MQGGVLARDILGNRHALRSGLYTAEMLDMRSEVASMGRLRGV